MEEERELTRDALLSRRTALQDGIARPLLPPMSDAHKGRKCLVLDLDETLLHSSFKVSLSSFPSPAPVWVSSGRLGRSSPLPLTSRSLSSDVARSLTWTSLCPRLTSADPASRLHCPCRD